MAHQYRLGKNLQASIDAFQEARMEFEGSIEDIETNLTNAVEEHREVWENASDAWRDSERGQAVEAWIDDISDLLSRLEEVNDALNAFDPSVLEEKP